jgi:hypothetical protein
VQGDIAHREPMQEQGDTWWNGVPPLAEALDITRFEVYESYLDEDYTNNRAKRLLIKSEACVEPSVWVGSPVGRMA